MPEMSQIIGYWLLNVNVWLDYWVDIYIKEFYAVISI